MTVGQVSNGSEANRVKPGDIAGKKKIEQRAQKPKANTANAAENVSNKTDRVEISHVAKSLLRKIVARNDFDKQKYPDLANLEEKFLQRLWQELGEELEIREQKVAEVATRLHEAYYDRPEIIEAAAEQIANELLGK